MKLLKHVYSISWKVFLFWTVVLLVFRFGISNLSDLVARNAGVEETIASDVILGEMGDGRALFRLGLHYSGQKDLRKARHYYTLASEKDHPIATNNLGALFEDGRGGVDKDIVTALKLYQRSAKNGGAYGYGNWARFQERGLGGLKKDESAAAPLRLKAAELGHPQSQYLVGLYHHQGNYGFPMDSKKSLYWLKKAADQENEEAQALLAKLTNVASK